MNNELNLYKQAIFTAFHNRYMGSNPLTLARKDALDAEFLDGLRVEEGRTYYKVITNGGSAHSFIVKVDGVKFKKGDILKAASWSSPAKNFARGNIFNQDSYKNLSWAG